LKKAREAREQHNSAIAAVAIKCEESGALKAVQQCIPTQDDIDAIQRLRDRIREANTGDAIGGKDAE
jgi:hypothetical protein